MGYLTGNVAFAIYAVFATVKSTVKYRNVTKT